MKIFTTLLEAKYDVERDRDKIYSDWQRWATLTAKELRAWKVSGLFRLASLKPEAVVDRNLRLLERKRSTWDTQDYRDAVKMINFNTRHTEAKEPGKPIIKDFPFSKRDVALINWAHRPSRISAKDFKFWIGKAGLEQAQEIFKGTRFEKILKEEPITIHVNMRYTVV